VPASGGEPKKISSEALSFWHGWSPDGKTIAYCGGADFNNLDVYTIPAKGGTPKRLTEAEGLDDGPDYSPDGKYIYFHSYRTKHMQIWRINNDGSNPEQITFDENSNWFAHPSPNNKWIAYIAYTSDEKQNHPFGKHVKLRLMDIKTKYVKDITPVFFGGAGTINTPSWSSDSKKIAFVSYAVK
jgi:Tol biopolymer transport system component